MMLAGLRYGSCFFLAVKLLLVTSKVMIAFKLFFEESLQGPPLVTDFVAKVL